MKKNVIYFENCISSEMDGTAQFKLDTRTGVLVQLLEKFVTQLASFMQAHNLWHEFNARDEQYAREVRSGVIYFTCKQSRYV